MAKMKFKLDMSAIKQFLFDKGEKVGLIACTLIMALVVAFALYSGFSARGTDKGEPWDAAITAASNRLNQAINNASLAEDELPKPPNPERWKWSEVRYLSHFLPLFPAPDVGGSKKFNPFVLPIRSGEDDKLFQMSYYQLGTFMWDIDTVNQKVTVLVPLGENKGGGGAAQPGFQPMGAVGGGKQPQGGAGGSANLAKQVRPTKMVVVSAIFPMREQLEEYRKALNYNTLEELLAKRDELPKPIGLEVARCEILPGGKATPWVPFISYDKKGKVVLNAVLKDMMRRMLIDEDEQHAAAQYIFPGLVTPLPKIANPGTRYEKVTLKGFDVKQPELADGGQPLGAEKGPMGANKGKPAGQFAMMPQFGKGKGPMGEAGAGAAAAAGADMVPRSKPWKDAPMELQMQFKEKYNVFDPLGQSAGTTGAEKKSGAAVGMNMSGNKDNAAAAGVWGWDAILSGVAASGGKDAGPMKGGEDGDEGANKTIGAANPVQINLDGALVRFFDPSVESGKTYCYTIRVKFANPNYKKPNDVNFLALSEQKELDPIPTAPAQGWVATPAITIPTDYHWYSVDQTPDYKIKAGADYGNPPYGVETVPIQVHRWVDKVIDANGEHTSADWAIAERLYQRRGEPVGRPKVMIELPSWHFAQQAWKIGDSAQANLGKPKPAPGLDGKAAATGIPVDLLTAPPTLVVDFDGGKKANFDKRDGGKEYIADVSAVEILVLTADGKLVVRNSRIDSESDPDISPAGSQRKDRYDMWRNRLAEMRGDGGVVGGPVGMPGGKKGGDGRN